ncbi:MAG: GerMN domain-containing protein, partial [Actinomycetia bacterium]|nr:GerMN domain-containing protein [Actinomycetes bacterium]
LSWWQKILEFFRKRGEAAEAEEAYPSRLTVNIYFAVTGEERILAAEERTIIAGSPGNALVSTMNELLKGPSKSYHFPVIPAGTSLIGAKAYEGVAEIDLSREFLENSLDSRILDEYIIYSIVNTVTEIPDINGVIFFIEGKRIKMYGNIDLSIPIIRDPDFLEEEEQ